MTHERRDLIEALECDGFETTPDWRDTYSNDDMQAEIARRGIEPSRCPDCNGLVSDDGYTIDPETCCFTCRMD